MAERRMLSKTIIDSDIFLDMPQTTQNLYFHLNMRADDEGFVNSPKKIMRMVGSNQNDLEILLSKRYVIAFESGVIVIKHWKLHNTIRKDRMKETLYLEEKKQLREKTNGSYTELQPTDNQLTTNCPPSVLECSIDKSIIDKSNKEGNKSPSKIETDFNEIYSFYPCKKGKTPALKKYKEYRRLKSVPDNQTLIEHIEASKKTKSWQDGFVPHFSTWMNQRRWEDEISEDEIVLTEEEQKAEIRREIEERRKALKSETWICDHGEHGYVITEEQANHQI
jgi:hypothetical protein